MQLNNILVDEFNEDIQTVIHNPVQQLQMMAVDLSGVSLAKAFAIDEGKAIGKILPDYIITTLCEVFYRRVYMSEEESKGENPAWFRELFNNKTMEEGVQDLSEYLMQRLGGKKYYTERKGMPNLLSAHCNIRDKSQTLGRGAGLLSERAAEKWLEHMSESLLELEAEINDDMAEKMMDFFRFQAYFLVVSVEQMKKCEARRSYDNDDKNLIS